MYSKEEALAKISELVEKFSDQLPAYKKSDYNETLTRKDFIDPFFEALGWDINNRSGAWEAYREVIHEDKLKIGGVTTAPDYSFRLTGGQRLFFVEAKKPSVVIKDDVAPAYQVRLYGWNAKLAISVVTDFEEFAIYDCSKKPLKTDKASKARLNYFTYKDYIKEFDFFWNTFSKQQVIKGGLVKFQQSDKKGTATVDKAFLENLDEWRKVLAANIYKNNPAISEDDLNYSVQQTIDRIIFLRIAEDRALEPYGQLKSSLQNENHYQELYRQFRVADDKYNSGLFHFKKEKENNETPDSISGNLSVDNKVVKSIIGSLYPPQCEYLFSVLPVEILGSAYEQFLGKQIVIKGSRANIEDKPEVRKAGGVYYTPQYIVEYIVEQTLGKLCEGKTPKEVSKLKVVDPACGSGSFLLGAYQYLLNWHIHYYAKNPVTAKQKEAVLTPEGNLTTAEKKRILLNNLYGVDIDRNAVEVTKLSLLLKCMQDETTASINTQMTFFHERVLPSLERNIKCGNSLIDLDFYDTEFDFGEEKKIKPFNWQQQFPEVFSPSLRGTKQSPANSEGFDVVIGNPPYVMLQTLAVKEVFDYALKKYYTANYKIDMYQLFIERSINLVKTKGLISFITPNTFLKNIHSEPLRKFILSNAVISELMLFDYNVFDAASVDTCISILIKDKADDKSELVVKKVTKAFYPEKQFFVRQDSFNKDEKTTFNLSANHKETELLNKIEMISVFLNKYCDAYFGIQTFDRKKYVSLLKVSIDYKPVIDGANIERYNLKPSYEYVEFVPEAIKSGGSQKVYIQDRICVRQIGASPIATFVPGNIYTLNTIYNIFLKSPDDVILEFLLGIINSSLVRFYWKKKNSDEKKTFPKIKKEAILSIPIIKLKSTEQDALKDEIIKNVDEILKLNDQKQKAILSEKLEQLNQRIVYTDEKINKLVYELYGLSEEEIRIVEGR